MKNYKEIFLNKLIDSYENSSIYKTQTQRNNKIYFKFNQKNIKEYYDEQNYIFKKEIDTVCLQLKDQGFIKIYKCKGLQNHIMDKIELNLEKTNEIYLYLNRKEKKEKNNQIQSLLNDFKTNQGVLGEFSRYITNKLEENQSVKKYLDIEDIKQCEDILKGLVAVLNQKEEIFRRNFSVKIYGDSKRYEGLENKIIKIINDFSNDDYINDYNILKNYTYVYFKGEIELNIGDSFINGTNFNGGVAISSKDIDNIDKIKVNGSKLLTIENLTTFNNYTGEGAIIYLGGYHNKIRQKLLMKIYFQNPKINYYHFGDIDAGGFKILAHLKRKTKIPFKPLYMDVQTLMDNIYYAKELTANDISEIKKLLEKEEFEEYFDVLKKMLETNKKLEQEIIF